MPHVRFAPQNVDASMVVLDSSALVDGRVVKRTEARLLSHAVAVQKSIIDELHELAISSIDDEKNRGGCGLNTISELKKIDHIDF